MDTRPDFKAIAKKLNCSEGTIRKRWREGTDLYAPILTESQKAKKARRNSPWDNVSPAIAKKS